MFTFSITPRFCETDALGHINNTVLPQWFEAAREPVFRLFKPDLGTADWNLILARIEVDFVAQIQYGRDVMVLTGIEKIGNASFVVLQEVWQDNVCVARGRAVQVYFNYQTQKSEALPADKRTALEAHLWQAPA